MEGIKCNVCNGEFGTMESLKQHSSAVHSRVKKKGGAKKYVLMGLLFIALVLFSYTVYVRAQESGEFDDFAKCLTEKGAVIYGNDFCSYTRKQLNFFGKSKEHLNYVKCSDNNDLCDSKGVTTTPTWEIDGKMYPQVQSFERLSAVSGCEV